MNDTPVNCSKNAIFSFRVVLYFPKIISCAYIIQAWCKRSAKQKQKNKKQGRFKDVLHVHQHRLVFTCSNDVCIIVTAAARTVI